MIKNGKLALAGVASALTGCATHSPPMSPACLVVCHEPMMPQPYLPPPPDAPVPQSESAPQSEPTDPGESATQPERG